jgi:hypothetical protein
MVYWQTITALLASTNWLVENHPDVYLYATLMEAAPYLKADPRIEVWKGFLEEALEGIHQDEWDRQWGGSLVRQIRPIG